jgi:hypothetical protein
MRWVPNRGVGVIALGNVTYAPMSLLARRMLEIIDEHGAIRTADVQPSPALQDAAHRLAVLVSDWTDSAAHLLFADNVAPDDSFARRARQAAELISAHGVLTLENVAAVTPMRGRATMRHADGTQRQFDLELSPLVPAQLQLYEVVAE